MIIHYLIRRKRGNESEWCYLGHGQTKNFTLHISNLTYIMNFRKSLVDKA